jgi:hypothetical protein
MAKGKKGKGDDKKAKEIKKAREAKEAAEAKLERDIITRIILFYTNKDTTHEQRLKVWEAVKGIIPEPPTPKPDEPKPDDTDGA